MLSDWGAIGQKIGGRKIGWRNKFTECNET